MNIKYNNKSFKKDLGKEMSFTEFKKSFSKFFYPHEDIKEAYKLCGGVIKEKKEES